MSLNNSLFVITLLFSTLAFGQHKSIHQEQLEQYNAIGKSATWYENNTTPAPKPPREKSACNLQKIVYGWHPYWSGNTYQNYDWDLISHFCYFSYELNASTGNASTTHNFSTSSAVTAALNSGNTKVTLCVTLFSSHSTFLNSSSAQQTLINNLITLLQNRGAHGVNIDFEGLPASQRTNFANFMVDLANQIHAAIPNSDVSTVLYAVDWNNVFDFGIMNSAVDHFIIMGYDYYYSGSSTAGPTDPLFHFGSNYNYTLSKSITDYLHKGCLKNKLVLGLPFYGREWPTQSTSVPSSTTGTGSAKLFKTVMNNTSGNYSAANHQFENDSYSDIFIFNSGGTRQCFITMDTGFRKRLELIVNTGIAGLGIWALGQDDGYNTFWTAIEDYLTDCAAQPCPGSIHDFGGPTRDYYANEDYTWTIAPPNAGSLTFTFSSFDTEPNFDKLYIYDGPNTSSPQIAGSPFSGSSIPPSFTSSLGAVTFRFVSDGADQRGGFNATYNCATGSSTPTTTINSLGAWKTTNFTETFTDQDNVSVSDSLYLVADFDGSEWRSNTSFGFLYDKFDAGMLSSEWTSQAGTWNVVSNELKQTDESSANTNLSTPITQDNQHSYLYEWKGKIEGTGTNRRLGMHFFCDDATQTNRNNSYLIYWYADQGKCRLDKASGNTLSLLTETNITLNPNNWYNLKVLYNPNTGEIKAFLDGVLVLSFTDGSPLQSGNAVSLRTGNCIGYYDNIKVYKSRGNTVSITIGNPASEVRYQNVNPTTPSCMIESIVLDGSDNWSTVATQQENIDWTPPSNIATINDGPNADINSFNTPNQISANWTGSSDSHSGLLEYSYAVGTTAGATDVVSWTSNGTSTSVTHTGLSLVGGTTYYVSVKAKNNAGLESAPISTDGQTLQGGNTAPIAGFNLASTVICSGDSIQFINTSTNATTFSWSFQGGTPATSSQINPWVKYNASGSYTVSLVAVGQGGSDTYTQSINIVISPSPTAGFSIVEDTLYLPNATAYFNNSSSNASSYSWDFGNGFTSIDINPWANYTSLGVYEVTLVAENGNCGSDTVKHNVVVNGWTTIEDNHQDLSITLYPNPIHNNLYLGINSTQDQKVRVSLTGVSGQIILQKELLLNKGVYNIKLIDDSTKLANGIYLVEVRNQNNVVVKRIIKE